MKCIQSLSSNEIVRIADDDAFKLVTAGKYKYVPRKAWREAGKKYRTPVEDSAVQAIKEAAKRR